MKVYELLDKPEKWCQGHMAEDHFGKIINADSSLACRWCLVGAICRCYPIDTGMEKLKDIVNKLDKVSELPLISVGIWNDQAERTYDEVVALCRELDI